MHGFFSFEILDKKIDHDSIWISKDSGGGFKIKFSSTLYRFRDKDTRQIILYLPSFDITGYGSTEQKATEMLKFSVNEYFSHLSFLSRKKLDEEFISLGWKKTLYKNKEYSKLYVTPDGELQNFNAVADKVERLTLQAV